MTCKDCIHYDEVCDGYIPMDTDPQYVFDYCAKGQADRIPGVEELCCTFKNKADFVEVVRCKECIHFIQDTHLDHAEYPNYLEADGVCDNIDKYVDNYEYCSSGVKKNNFKE